VGVVKYRPKLWHLAAAWVVFAAALFCGAALGGKGHDSFWWVLGRDFLQAVGAVALAFGGLGGLIEWRIRRRWKMALDVIAVDLLDQTMRHTGAITARAAYILLGDNESAYDIDHAFDLPWTTENAEAVQDARLRLAEGALAAFHDSSEVRERFRKVAREVAERGDKVRAAATELESHVAANHALPLLREVGWLHRRVRELTDEGPRLAGSTEAGQVLPGISALLVLEAGVKVAQNVQEPFRQLRRELKDKTLLSELVGREALQGEAAKSRREMRERDEWLANWQRETDEVFRQMDEGLAELSQAISDLRPVAGTPTDKTLE
jgi:hypothetical protein